MATYYCECGSWDSNRLPPSMICPRCKKALEEESDRDEDDE